MSSGQAGVEGEVVLAGAQVRQDVGVPAVEGTVESERHRVLLAHQLQVEPCELVIEGRRLAVADDRGRVGGGVVGDGHGVVAAIGDDAERGCAAGVGEGRHANRGDDAPLEGFQVQTRAMAGPRGLAARPAAKQSEHALTPGRR
jgi:hypothetical protein